jgi:DNA repair protein RadC
MNKINVNDKFKIMELASKYLLDELKTNTDVLSSPEIVKIFLHTHMYGKKNECFCVLFLTSQHNLIAFEELFHGSINSSAVYPRVVAMRALELNASAVIFAHNHPGGIANPSLEDKNITKVLTKALELFEIKVLDHLIIGNGNNTTSMKEQGMI